MSTRDEPWDEGTPSWADLSSTDPAGAQQFYGSVFGWEFMDTGGEYGNYSMAQLEGRTVAGIGAAAAGAPVAWTTYLATPDADAAVARITEHGGTVVASPMDIGDSGRLAVAADPTGATFGLWQADTFVGAGIVNQPGTMVWNELLTRDSAAAREFYGAVVGHTYTALPGDLDYTTIDGAGPGNCVGGLGALGDDVPADLPSHWMTYFEVEDSDAVAAKATETGGTVQAGPFDSPFGRIAVLRDPQGATFSVIQTQTSGESQPPAAG